MARAAAATLTALLVAAFAGLGAAYPNMAGSCEGVFSGNHVDPAEVGKPRGDGGWRFRVVLGTSTSSTKTANVSVVNDDPAAWFMGFLLKAFDLETGKYIGKFPRSGLPQFTQRFEGCPVPEAALSHDGLGYWNGKEQALTVAVEWPAERELGFAIFPVRSLFEWYEVYGSTSGLKPAEGLHNAMLYQGFFSPRLGNILGDCSWHCSTWALLHFGLYAPIILIVAVGVLAKSTNGPGGPGSKLNHTVPVNNGPLILQISIGEWLSLALFVLVQATILALMVVQIGAEGKDMPYSEYDGVQYPPNPWDATVGRALGRLLQGNLALTLLLPTRNSVWPALVGISFERFVKYHRVMGRWTFINLVCHFVAMWMTYDVDCLTARRGRWGYGNLYGLLAGISMLLAVLSAAEPIRRKSYELFLALHMMALPSLLFAVLHVNDTLMHFIVPLALYTLDWAIRIHQWTRRAQVLSAEVLPKGATRLRLRCPAVAKAIWDEKAAGIGTFVYLQASAVDKNPLAWHPFSVCGLESSTSANEMQAAGQVPSAAARGYAQLCPGEVPDSIAVTIRDMGAGTWSGALHAAVLHKQPVAVRIEGPYGHLGIDLSKYSHVLAVSGGIGFTPTGPLIQMVLDHDRRRTCLPLLQSLHVVWVVRGAETFSWFQDLLRSARALKPSSGESWRRELDMKSGRAKLRQS